MALPKVDEATFEALVRELGPKGTAIRLGLGERAVHQRRAAIEKRRGYSIAAPSPRTTRIEAKHDATLRTTITDGVVLVGSDSHYWPIPPSTAHRAFVRFCERMNPKIVVKNGDELDGASISRHAPIGWEGRPRLIEEIDTVKARLEEIASAAPDAELYWPLGNHDARFSSKLATVAPEYAQVHGVHLKDHFPHWSTSWSLQINNDVVVKHRYKNGIHASHNNTMWAGKTVVTGHLHSLKVSPFTDYNGTRYGVDCGTMAPVNGPQFEAYMEENPRNWRSGFVVLTFKDGRLLWPEVVFVRDEAAGIVEFRGEEIRV